MLFQLLNHETVSYHQPPKGEEQQAKAQSDQTTAKDDESKRTKLHLMDRRVHRKGADRALQKLVDASGSSR